VVDSDRRRAAEPPIVIANPSHDRAFVALAEQIVAEGIATPEAMQAELRKKYPRAAVSARQLAAEGVRTWYAYRDGHWLDSRDEQGM